MRRVGRSKLPAVLAAVGGVVLVLLLAKLLPKGAYVASAGAAILALLGAVLAVGAGRGGAHPLQWAGALGLSAALPLVLRHWNGTADLWPVLVWLAYAWLTLLLARALGWWRSLPQALLVPGTLLVAMALMVPVLGGYYMGLRFGVIERDLAGRGEHWRDVLALLDEPRDWLLGKGEGRFVDDYYWHNRRGESPGAFALHDAERRFVRLVATRHAPGFSGVVRLNQRVAYSAGAHTLSATLRSARPGGVMHVSLCDKWLLYPYNCRHARARGIGTAWQEVSLHFDPAAGSGGKVRLRPRSLSLSTNDTDRSHSIDVAAVSLTDLHGRSLLRNEGFADKLQHWYYTSDRNHLPWHAKNMWLHVLYEQGVFGLASFTLLLLAAGAALIDKARRGDGSAPLLLAALAGVVAVGLFDSLLDFPRIEWLIFLLLLLSLLRRDHFSTAPRSARGGGR
jgi:hypothetical protein